MPDDVNLHAAADWLAYSMDVCEADGSSVTFSLPRMCWYPAYPETTGYIVPTFYRYGHSYERAAFVERATRMAEWLITLQYDDGAFPGGHHTETRNPPSVFNTAQIIIGMMAAFDETGQQRFLDAGARAARWLADQQDRDGQWTKYAYRPRYSPSYYTRVCWPMLMTTVHTQDEHVRAAAQRGLEVIANRQAENGVIRQWTFDPGRPAFTHGIAYTIRGMLESADLLRQRAGLGEVAKRAALKLMRLFELKKRIAGAYDEEWRGRYWYTCLTGNCQLALCWLRLFDWGSDPRLVNAACKAIDTVTRVQRLDPRLPRFMCGGVAGSSPIFGRYLTLRYPNWAAKFLMDAIMFRNERLERLRVARPMP